MHINIPNVNLTDIFDGFIAPRESMEDTREHLDMVGRFDFCQNILGAMTSRRREGVISF